jgi:hypothetical protein
VYFNRICRSAVASLVVLLCAAPALATVSLTISQNDATPGSTVAGAGQTFSFTVNLVSTAEQTTGLDYYLTTPDGAGLFSIVDRNTPTLIYKTRSFSRTGEYPLDSLWSNRDTIDIMPNGLATDTLKLSLVIKSRGGTPYAKSVRASKGGLVRLDNR